MPPSALSLAVNTPTILCQTVRGVISTDALWEERQSGETSGGNQTTDETAGSLQTGYLSVSVLLFVCLFLLQASQPSHSRGPAVGYRSLFTVPDE